MGPPNWVWPEDFMAYQSLRLVGHRLGASPVTSGPCITALTILARYDVSRASYIDTARSATAQVSLNALKGLDTGEGGPNGRSPSSPLWFGLQGPAAEVALTNKAAAQGGLIEGVTPEHATAQVSEAQRGCQGGERNQPEKGAAVLENLLHPV